MHLSITGLTARVQKNSSCAMGITISDSYSFLIAESSIWWVVLSDSTNAFCYWELLIGFKVLITRLDTMPGKNSEEHDHGTRSIYFKLAICKDA